MKFFNLVTAIVLLGFIQLTAQSSIFIPRNVNESYESGIRNYDGTPGEKYWQNSSEYMLNVEIVPETRMVKGSGAVVYHNNSPDALNKIVVRFYHDIYKKGNARDFQMNEKAINEGMKLERLVINDEEMPLSGDKSRIRRTGTNLLISLENPLESEQSAVFEFEWSFVIPKEGNLRMGTYDSTSFFVAYWYPEIAVYDDIDGWDVYNYTGQTEFYHDFSNYNINITVPENFTVWATGVLQNPDEIFREDILKKYNEARTSDEIINVINEDDYKKGIVTKSGENTFNFVAENIEDFTFALSDHYYWDLTSLVVDGATGRRTVVGAAYKKESKDFYEVAEIAKQSIKFFSEEMPGVPYPFPELTVFNGSGGMESPMMVNDGSSGSRAGTVGVTSHEIAHSYFPFYMGTNERKYAWMDEGWATMLPFDFQSRSVENNDPLKRNVMTYSAVAGIEIEMPPMVLSVFLRRNSYRIASYARSGIAYQMLRETLGDELFKKALHTYIERWAGKHPLPYDFFFSFNDAVGEDLSWFWKPWFFEFGYPDLAINNVKVEGNVVTVTVIKKGVIPVPVSVYAFTDDNEKAEAQISETASVWADGKTSLTLKLQTTKPITKIILGDDHIPDVDKSNNEYIIEQAN